MCGIAGKIYLKSGKIDERDLALMSDKIAHRGPDGQESRLGAPPLGNY